MKMTLYTANCRGDKANTSYPNRVEVNNAEDLENAAKYDHVCAEYRSEDVTHKRKDGTVYTEFVPFHRSIKAFVKSDCLPFDLDNGHSDDPNEWKTLDSIRETFPGVPFYAVPSRNHMKEKSQGKGKPTLLARPRYHIYFPIDEITDAGEYKALKEAVIALFPWFDMNAKDAARFLFGVANPVAESVEGADQ